MIYDWTMMIFMLCFLLGGDAIGEAGFQLLSWWCTYYCYNTTAHRQGADGPEPSA
jgi:hypothetical protein